MRFILGLLIGLALGLTGALLFAPSRGRLQPEEPGTSEEGEGRRVFSENGDAAAALRRAMERLQKQVQEAWGEAREAAREAEEEMRARYEKARTRGQ
jgi:gas vesicle protein